MNTIYYTNGKETRTVRVGQGGVDWFHQVGKFTNRKANGKLSLKAPRRRLTMAEADARMYRAGFVRGKRGKQ